MAILPAGSDNSVSMYVPHEYEPPGALSGDEEPVQRAAAVAGCGAGRLHAGDRHEDRFYTHALELATSGKVPPLRTLNGDFPYDASGALASYSYSLSVVMYILDTWGNEGLSKLIAAFPAGVTFDQAVQQGLGISFDELDRRWREDYYRRRAAAGRGRLDPFRRQRSRLTLDLVAAGPRSRPRLGDAHPGAGRPDRGGRGTGLAAADAATASAPEDEVDLSGVMWREWPEGAGATGVAGTLSSHWPSPPAPLSHCDGRGECFPRVDLLYRH